MRQSKKSRKSSLLISSIRSRRRPYHPNILNTHSEDVCGASGQEERKNVFEEVALAEIRQGAIFDL